MIRANENNLHKINIKWTKPVLYDKSNFDFEEEDYTWFYKILAKYSSKKYKLLYIGKTTRAIKARLNDKDHKHKYYRLKNLYPKHQILLSFGIVNEEDDFQDTKVDDIETLLIYAHQREEFPFIENKNKIYAHRIKTEYQIINSGFRKDGFRKEISLGVFFK